MPLDKEAALALAPGTRVIIRCEDRDRSALRCVAPFEHMEPAFRWADAPPNEHPLAWMDISEPPGRVRLPERVTISGHVAEVGSDAEHWLREMKRATTTRWTATMRNKAMRAQGYLGLATPEA